MDGHTWKTNPVRCRKRHLTSKFSSHSPIKDITLALEAQTNYRQITPAEETIAVRRGREAVSSGEPHWCSSAECQLSTGPPSFQMYLVPCSTCVLFPMTIMTEPGVEAMESRWRRPPFLGLHLVCHYSPLTPLSLYPNKTALLYRLHHIQNSPQTLRFF